MIKAENYTEYLNRKYQIEFTLPRSNSVEPININAIYGLKVFIGLSNNEIKARTEISVNLNSLQFDIKKFKGSIKPYKRYQIETHKERLDNRFHFRVFADSTISDSEITKQLAVIIKGDKSLREQYLPLKFKETLSDTLPIRIFRVYQSEEEPNFSNTLGKEIESLSKNVYE